MQQLDEKGLSILLSDEAQLRQVESSIFSVFPNNDVGNSYDNKFGTFYDIVACNPIYNRLIWGYSTAKIAKFTASALTSSSDGTVLDIGCGALAFNAKAYATINNRPAILLDQSLKLLKMAKSRIIKMHGKVPANILFLHADATQLPFKPGSFSTVISLNLLHVLTDIDKVLVGIKNVRTVNSNTYFTTLVVGNRLADKYMKVWEDAGELVARNINDLKTIFKKYDLSFTYELDGNMAFINCQ